MKETILERLGGEKKIESLLNTCSDFVINEENEHVLEFTFIGSFTFNSCNVLLNLETNLYNITFNKYDKTTFDWIKAKFFPDVLTESVALFFEDEFKKYFNVPLPTVQVISGFTADDIAFWTNLDAENYGELQDNKYLVEAEC